jgi:hypothetical protein
MNKLLFLLPALFLLACGNDNVNGGSCTYISDTVGATIVRMDSTGTPYPDIVLHVTTAKGDVDSIRYSNNTNENITWDTAIARGYKVGVKLKTRHELRTSGHCDPEYFIVTKEIMK